MTLKAELPLLNDMDFCLNPMPDLHRVMDELRSSGAVVPVTFLGENTWIITRFAELKEAMSDEEHFPMKASYEIHAKPAMGHTMETMTGEEHRVNRGLVSKSFLPKEVRRLVEPLMEVVARELLDDLEKKDLSQPIDLMAEFIQPYPFKVITRLMGVAVDDDAKFLHWADKLIQYGWDPEGALKAKKEFTEYLAPIVADRRLDPQDDLISVLTQSEFESEQLSDELIYSFCRLMFPAGSDTTFRSMGNMISVLLADDELKGKILESEAARLDMVQEILRFEPSAPMIPRRCAKSRELGGVQIEKDDWIIFGIAAANRDPEVFDEPHKFKLGRKERNLGLGHGVHMCLGQHFTRAEMEVALRLLFERFPKVQLVEGKEPSILGSVVRGPADLWVTLS